VDKHAMDVDTADTLAGAVRLLRRAAGWLGLPRIARRLDRLGSCSLWVSTSPRIRGGTWSRTAPRSTTRCQSVTNPASLLRSAELLLRRVAPIARSDALDDLRATVADLVWEANTGVGG
jgi:hypothetical protein